jgi:hypothetical protein
MHHMYSLATDFYGLGIMKDPDAFKKPMLWLRFAKACKRCGRKEDAQLAIKVRSRSIQYCDCPQPLLSHQCCSLCCYQFSRCLY